MDGQLSFATLDYAGKKKRTKRDANGGWCIDPAEFHRTRPGLVLKSVANLSRPRPCVRVVRRIFERREA